MKEKIKSIFPAICNFCKDNWLWGVLLLYGTALLMTELLVCYRYGVNKTILNPFIQSWPFILLVYAVGRLIPGWAGKLYFSFFIVLSTTLIFIGVFLLNVFNLPPTTDIYFVLAASSVEESREFMSNFVNLRICLALFITTAIAVSMLILVWKSSFRRSKAGTVLALALMIPFLINVIRFTVTRDWPSLYKRNLETEMPVIYFIFRHSLNNLVSMATHPKLPAGSGKRPERRFAVSW